MSEKEFLKKEYAQKLDLEDELKQYRDEFYLQPETIYFDGNSLGLLSKRAEKALHNVLESWKTYGIDGWLKGEHPWFYFPEKLGKMTAPLIGADPKEVIVTGSTTVNLHQIVSTFYKPEGKRTKILADELNFPSDIYALKSQLMIRGLDPEEHLIQVKSRDGITICEEDIIEAMTDEVVLIVLAGVLYRSGQILDIKRITEEAHKRGILVAFDLCHSIGSIQHSLSEWSVDFAFWCSYKHLNGGPGAVAGMYVNEKHFGAKPGLAGWFSSDKNKQFDMEHNLTPAQTAGAMQMGTPNLLSAAPLLGSLSMFEEAGMDKIRAKSLKMTDYMIQLIDTQLSAYHFKIGSPLDSSQRGGHVLLEHQEAARICKALKDNGVIPDYRTPNGIRLAPAALYNTFQEVWEVVQILKKIMSEEQYKKFENKRDVVS
ncbi:kynureninase [Bacillus sp. DTU_2020_1000418_1_SI_GHA_SEK_038]|uniref:kynureninase n=1 Tax=Bacillus sp. DTU_2020_1000418_1_SI_GHA_SEK_038 TaxID=3077585 RepID=UPI0028F133EA|nr:kynureninase [Bacillus sp. DTU_2020_1000418_1_SI_GHA_SEK_038]WNS75416.1 kynureninase [Bacillus sp. DTU_2020_1000418_1_SI_GHA_SEK_038]